MFNAHGFGLGSVVQPDPVDERDRSFSELTEEVGSTAGERPTRRRLDDSSRGAWARERDKGLDLGLPAMKICDDYRQLADVAWHQRGQECTGFALAAIADYHIRRHYLANIENDLAKREEHRNQVVEHSKEQADERNRVNRERRAARREQQPVEFTAEHFKYLPQTERDNLTVSRRMMYEMAQEYDRQSWTSGSTTRGALKGWMHSGVAAEKEWPYVPDDEEGTRQGRLGLKRVIDSVRRPGAEYYRIENSSFDDMKLALAANYPLFVNSRLHSGWYEPYLPAPQRPSSTGPNGPATNTTRIRQFPGMKLLEGHAFVIVGYDHDGWLVHNSWGPQWGDNGFAVLPYDDWVAHGTDVWFVLPPFIRRKHPVQEDRFLPTSEIAKADGELARAELGLDELRTRHAIARAGIEHLRAATADETVADATSELLDELPAAVAVATDEVARLQRAIDASQHRSGVHSAMWRHVIAIGDDGRLVGPGNQYGLSPAGLGTLLWMFRHQTEDWKTRRLVIIADGGYWSTAAAAEQLNPFREQMIEQEIYPIFLLWETPWYADTAGWLWGNSDLHPDRWYDLDKPYHSRPTQYANAAEYPAPRIFKQMKQRAVNASRVADGAARHLAKSIHYGRKKKAFEIHLVGHGVGDLLLPGLAGLLPPIASCNLWAPATTIESFCGSFGPMLESGRLGGLALSVLEQDRERGDRFGPVPGSVLQLVSDVLAVDDLDLDEILDTMDWNDPVWPVKPVPLLGLHRDLVADSYIERLTAANRIDVNVIGRGTHLDLLRDGEVHASTIENILAGPPDDAPRTTSWRTQIRPTTIGPTSNRRPSPLFTGNGLGSDGVFAS